VDSSGAPYLTKSRHGSELRSGQAYIALSSMTKIKRFNIVERQALLKSSEEDRQKENDRNSETIKDLKVSDVLSMIVSIDLKKIADYFTIFGTALVAICVINRLPKFLNVYGGGF
jgi:hypothetical protein